MSHEFSNEYNPELDVVIENPEFVEAKKRAVTALNERGHEDLEARDFLDKYAELCHRDADKWAAEVPGDPEVSNMANIRASIKLARLWMEVRDGLPVAKQSFEEILMAARQDESTHILAQEVLGCLEEIDENLL